MPTCRCCNSSLPILALACAAACGGATGDQTSASGGATDSDTDAAASTTTDTAAPTTSGTTAWEEESESEPEQPVRVEWDGLELRLVRGVDVLLRVPADGFQLGEVAALDDASSYDPVFLAPDEWLTLTAAEPLGGE